MRYIDTIRNKKGKSREDRSVKRAIKSNKQPYQTMRLSKELEMLLQIWRIVLTSYRGKTIVRYRANRK